MDSEFLTADEISNYLRLPLSTVYKLAQERRIPSFKVGKHWRFRYEAIKDWINEQELNRISPSPDYDQINSKHKG